MCNIATGLDYSKTVQSFFFFITDHVDKLLDLIFDRVFQDLVTYVDEVLKIPITEDLSAQFDKT